MGRLPTSKTPSQEVNKDRALATADLRGLSLGLYSVLLIQPLPAPSPTPSPSPQSSKVLAKRELLCVPLIGWTWYFLEIVFCKRKWEEDRDTVIEGLKRLADYPEYMWVSVPCMFHEMPVAHRCPLALLSSTKQPKF